MGELPGKSVFFRVTAHAALARFPPRLAAARGELPPWNLGGLGPIPPPWPQIDENKGKTNE
jgi:hypothetical protein